MAKKKKKNKKVFSPVSSHKETFTGTPKRYWDRLGRQIGLGDQIIYMDENYIDHAALILSSDPDGTLYASKIKSIYMLNSDDKDEGEEYFTTEFGQGMISIARKSFKLEDIPDKGSIIVLRKMDYYKDFFYCKIW